MDKEVREILNSTDERHVQVEKLLDLGFTVNQIYKMFGGKK